MTAILFVLYCKNVQMKYWFRTDCWYKLHPSDFVSAVKLNVLAQQKAKEVYPLFSTPMLYEPVHKKTNNLQIRKQRRRSAVQFSVFVFATQKVQSLLSLNLKVQASTLLLLLYRPVCVRSRRKPKSLVFSCTSS